VDKIRLTIDGVQIEAEPGMTVLHAALQNGIYVPHLCDHPDLDPVGVCRLCMVEVEGRGLVLSCRLAVEEGLVVCTDSPQVANLRRIATELLIANHPEDCLSCDQNGDCKLQQVASYVGIDADRLARLRRGTRQLPIDESNPFFDYDPNRCVLCGICVRTCHDLQNVSAIDFASRGYDTTVATFAGGPIAESRCESCGECVVRCPVGALTAKQAQRPAREVKTVCPYCGVGCGLYLGVRGSKIVASRGDPDNPVNKGRLCVKGRFGYEFVNHPDRLKTPLIKRDGRFVEVGWDEALDRIAEEFSQCKGEKFAALTSAKCTNEENYVVQKLGRVVMDTNNIDHCARL